MSNPDTLVPAADDASSLNLGVLEDLIGFRLRMATLALYRDFTAALEGLDLTQRQVATLELVNVNPGVSQVELANVLGTDRATMMSVVDRLDRRKLLYRERSKADRRRQELYLTEAGQALLTQAKTRVAEHERKFTARFTPDELEAFRKALKRVQQVR